MLEFVVLFVFPIIFTLLTVPLFQCQSLFPTIVSNKTITVLYSDFSFGKTCENLQKYSPYHINGTEYSQQLISLTFDRPLVSETPFIQLLNRDLPQAIVSYNICFEDYGSVVESCNPEKNLSVKDWNLVWTVDFSQEKNLSVSPKKSACVSLPKGTNFTYSWAYNLTITEPEPFFDDAVIFYPKIRYSQYPECTPFSLNLFWRYILICLGWWTLVWLFTRVKKMLKEGFDA
jgi:hypothetical protein